MKKNYSDILEKNGYFIIKNFLNKNKKFNNFSKEINKIIFKKVKKEKLSNYGGSIIGNINVYPGKYGKKIFQLLRNKGLDQVIKNCTGVNLENFNVSLGGNLSLPGKHNQHFHIDGGYFDKMLIVTIATSDTDINSGPTEIVLKSHKKNLTYLDFLLSKKNKTKLLLSRGDLLIRKHNLWHRGTINYTNKARFQIAFMFFEKKRKIKQKLFGDKLYFFNNFFDNTYLGKLKEFIYIYIKPIYVLYKLINSKSL